MMPRNSLLLSILIVFFFSLNATDYTTSTNPSGSGSGQCDGSWNDTDCWDCGCDPSSGGVIAANDRVFVNRDLLYDQGNDLKVDGEINIGSVTVSGVDFDIPNGRNVFIHATGTFSLINGTMLWGTFTCGGGSMSGGFSCLGGDVTIIGSRVDVNENWSSSSGSTRFYKDGCLRCGHNYEVNGETDYDILDNTCIEVGYKGSGNFLNKGTIEVRNNIRFLHGNYDTNNDCTGGSSDFKNDKGDIIGTGTITHLEAVSAIVDVPGNWTVPVTVYCNNGAGYNGPPSTLNCTPFNGLSCTDCTAFLPPAPVEMIYFRGSEKNRKTTLEWATAIEINNKGFEIQRSPDGELFEVIGFVNGHGNSSSMKKYDFLDLEPYAGENIYRLRQVDYDGAFEYSKTVPIMIEASLTVEAVPNPARSDELVINIFSEVEEDALLTIMDLTGIVHMTKNYNLKSGGNMLDVSNLELPTGVYFAETRIGYRAVTSKFLIQN